MPFNVERYHFEQRADAHAEGRVHAHRDAYRRQTSHDPLQRNPSSAKPGAWSTPSAAASSPRTTPTCTASA